MADNFNKGTFGEQGAGFFFGSQGYFLVEGPSGTQEPGHAANAPGFDGVAYNVKTDHLIIYDNKTFKSDRNVGCGTAIDPKVNFGKNLEGLIRRMQSAKRHPPAKVVSWISYGAPTVRSPAVAWLLPPTYKSPSPTSAATRPG